MIPWPHQARLPAEIAAAEAEGCRRILIACPTGGGKSWCITDDIINHLPEEQVLYTHRKMLREQLERRLTEAGIEYGVRASGVAPALLRNVQISSLQTEHSRVLKKKTWELHKGKRVHVDEAHVQKGEVAETIFKQHVEDGATIFGWTATPVDLADMYDRLIVAATNSELRDCGALVWCDSYGPDEPDMRKFKPNTKTGEYTEGDVVKAIMTPTVFGRVYDWWKRLNQDAKPTILFGPDVKGSLYFAEEFKKKGIQSAHIDGDDIWIDGELYPSSQEVREQLAEASRTGEVKIVCNRFVMREGIDWPWLAHCIMATVFGSVASYIQSGGRLLRAHPTLDRVKLQDHGGNWHRHGSLNADRQWELCHTAPMLHSLRCQRIREGKEKQPIVCPECGKVRGGGAVCACGYHSTKTSRRVLQIDGTLRDLEIADFKPRVERMKPNTLQLWTSMYWRAKRSKNGMTFNQARGLFFYDNHYWPPKNLPMMPRDEVDWFRKVRDVPTESLIRQEKVA